MTNNLDLLNQKAIEKARLKNPLEEVKKLIEEGADDMEAIAIAAALNKEGFDLVKYLIEERGTSNINEIAYSAALNDDGNEIVKYLINKGANNFSEIALIETMNPNGIEIIKICIDRGINNIDEVSYNAAINKNYNALELAFNSGAKNFALIAERFKNNEQIMNILNKFTY